MQKTEIPFERKESPTKLYKRKRDEAIIQRFHELHKAGTGKMMAYRTIADEITPPLDFYQVFRILKKSGTLDLIESTEAATA